MTGLRGCFHLCLPRPLAFAFYADQCDGVVVLVGSIECLDDLEGPVAAGEHDAPHVHHRVQHGDAEPVRDLGICGDRLDRFLRADDRDAQFSLESLQQRNRVQLFCANAGADVDRQVVDRE